MVPIPIPALKQSLDTNLEEYEPQIMAAVSANSNVYFWLFNINLFLCRNYKIQGEKRRPKAKRSHIERSQLRKTGRTAVMKYSRSKCPEVQKMAISSITF